MDTYRIELPVGNIRLDDLETLNEQGYVANLDFATRTVLWEVEADSPFDLGILLVETFDEWVANGLFDLGDLDASTIEITPDPRR